jgi:hypothetical protein
MPVESSNQSGDWNSAREALAEMRACPGELQTFILSVFDQLDSLASELLAHELAGQQAQRQAGSEALQNQIDRLASVAAELSKAVAEQKALVGQIKGNGREKSQT